MLELLVAIAIILATLRASLLPTDATLVILDVVFCIAMVRTIRLNWNARPLPRWVLHCKILSRRWRSFRRRIMRLRSSPRSFQGGNR